jgi:hypothetical protein
MVMQFKLCEGVAVHSFGDSSGSVFYNDISGDILSVPVAVSLSKEKGLFTFHENFNNEYGESKSQESISQESISVDMEDTSVKPFVVRKSIEQLVKRNWITLQNA